MPTSSANLSLIIARKNPVGVKLNDLGQDLTQVANDHLLNGADRITRFGVAPTLSSSDTFDMATAATTIGMFGKVICPISARFQGRFNAMVNDRNGGEHVLQRSVQVIAVPATPLLCASCMVMFGSMWRRQTL